MNRLVIIGNGFDLAHGLPTKYSDFIDWFWSNIRAKYKTLEYQEILEIDDMNAAFITDYGLIKTYDEFLDYLERHAKNNGLFFHQQESKSRSGNYIFGFKNMFFKLICKSYKEKNWVNIENEYYDLVKDCLTLSDRKNPPINIITLNKEFEQVKRLLEKFLTEEILNKIDFFNPNENANLFLNLFEIQPKYLLSQEGSIHLKEYSKIDHQELVEFDLKLQNSNLHEEFKYGKIPRPTNIFLNFNYTFSIDSYIHLIGENSLDYMGIVNKSKSTAA